MPDQNYNTGDGTTLVPEAAERLQAEHEQLLAIIAALHLADVAKKDDAQFAAVARVILGKAPEIPAGHTGGPALILDLQREGKLDFVLTDRGEGT